MRIRIGSVGLRRVGWVESGVGGWGSLLPATECYIGLSRRSILAARMKSLSVKPSMACVQIVNSV